MANNISPSKVIYYISQKRKILVGRNNQVNQDLLKFDYRVTDKFNFQVVNSINQILPPTSTKYELFGSYVDNKQQLHILFFAQNDPVSGNTIPFTVDTYTSEFMNYVKIEKEIDLTIVAVNPENDNDKSMVLRDRALVYPRPYIQGRVPTQILQRTILSFNNPVSGLFAAGSNFSYIDRTVNNFSLGEGLYTDTENQLVIGSYNEPSGTTEQAFVIGNGEDNTHRSNALSIDYDGNIVTNGTISASTIYVNGKEVGTQVDEKLSATSAWVTDTFETKVDAAAAHNSLTLEIEGVDQKIDAVSAAVSAISIPTNISYFNNDVGYLVQDNLSSYATKSWVEGKNYLVSSDLNSYATKQWVQNQGYLTEHQSLSAYATKSWVESKNYLVEADLNSYATKQWVGQQGYLIQADLNGYARTSQIPTKVSDLTNDAKFITSAQVPVYTAGEGIQIQDYVISLTGSTGQSYEAGSGIIIDNGIIKTNLIPGQNITFDVVGNKITINAISGGSGGGGTYNAGQGLNKVGNTFSVDQDWLSTFIDTQVGDIETYTAGTGISISNENVISLTAAIPSTVAELTDSNDYATKQWVENKGYLTEHQSLSAYATSAEIDAEYAKKTDIPTDYLVSSDLDNYALKSEIPVVTGFATKDELSAVDNKFTNYDTSTEVDDKITAAIATVPSTVYNGTDGIKVDNGVISLTATLSDITNDAGFITSSDLDGYATETYVDGAVSSKLDTSTFETVSGELNNAIAARALETDLQYVSGVVDNKANASALNDYVLTSAMSAYAESGWVDTNYMKKGDVPTDVYTKTETDEAITAATSGKADLSSVYTKEEVYTYLETDARINAATSGKADLSAVEAEFTATSAWANETFLTEHQSLDDYYTKTEVNNISTNIVNQIPTDVATSAYVQAASGNAVSVATGWVDDQNYLTEVPSEYITETELATELEPYAQSADVTTAITNATSGKADQSTVESLSTALSTAIDTKANSADVYTKTEVYTKGETDTAINTATSGKVNKSDFDTVTGALSTAIDGKTTSGEVKTQIEAYGYQTATDVANAITGKADKSTVEAEFTSTSTYIGQVSGNLQTAIGTATTDMATQTWANGKFETQANALTAYNDLTGKISTASTTLTAQTNYLSGQIGTNATNIGTLRTDVDTISTTYATKTYVDTTSSTLSTQLTGWVDENYVTGYTAGSGIEITENNVINIKANMIPSAVSQIINDVGYITVADLPEGTVYGVGPGLAASGVGNNVFYLTGTVLSGDGSTIAITDNVISVIGGGGGATYTAGEGIAISNENVISLTATIPTSASQLTNDEGFITGININYNGSNYNVTELQIGNGLQFNEGIIQLDVAIPTNTSDLNNDSGFATSAQVSAIVTGYNYLTGITIEDAYDQTSHVSSLVLTDDFSYYDQLYWNGLLVDNQAGQGSGGYRAKKLVFSNDFSIYFGDEVSEISINSDILSTYATKSELQTTSASIVALIPSAPSTVYDKLSAGSNITLSKNDQTGVTTITAAGSYPTIKWNDDYSGEVSYVASSITFDGFDMSYTEQQGPTDIFVSPRGVKVNDYTSIHELDFDTTDFSINSNEDVIEIALANPIPTNVSDLNNDSGFATSAYVTGQVNDLATGAVATNTADITALKNVSGDFSNYYTKTEADAAFLTATTVIPVVSTYIGGTGISITSSDTNQYTVAFDNTSLGFQTSTDVATYLTTNNYVTSGQISATYAKTTDIPTISTYVAGTNVTITPVENENKFTVSATDTTYTAGTGLKLTGTEFSLSAAGANEDKVLSSHNGTISWETNVAAGGNYTEGTGIDISAQDVISIDQTWFENSVSSLVSSDMDAAASAAVENYIELSGLATGTGLFYDDTDNSLNVVLSSAQDGNINVSVDENGVILLSAGAGGSTYTAGTGIDITNNVISLTADIPTVPSTVYDKLSAGENITLSKNDQTGVTTITAAGGGDSGPTNQQTISTGFVYDSTLEVVKNTYTSTDGVITLSAFEVPAGSLDSNKVATFEEWVYSKGTLTGFAFDGVKLIGEIPSGISQTNYYIFTRRILGSGDQLISFAYSDIDYKNMPFTIKSVGGTTTVSLSSTNYSPSVGYHYSKNGSDDWSGYISKGNGSITLQQGEYVSLSGTNSYIGTSYTEPVNSVPFVMTGTGKQIVYGKIASLINWNQNQVLSGNGTVGALFANCTNLVDASNLNMPYATVSTACYDSMFRNCTSLTAAPELPATTVYWDAYGYMFHGCTSLSTAPIIQATTINGSDQYTLAYAFSGCTSLTGVEIMLTNNNSNTFYWAFRGCTNLQYVKVHFTNWGNQYGNGSWLSGVAANGEFHCPTALGTNASITRGEGYVPVGWTVINDVE